MSHWTDKNTCCHSICIYYVYFVKYCLLLPHIALTRVQWTKFPQWKTLCDLSPSLSLTHIHKAIESDAHAGSWQSLLCVTVGCEGNTEGRAQRVFVCVCVFIHRKQGQETHAVSPPVTNFFSLSFSRFLSFPIPVLLPLFCFHPPPLVPLSLTPLTFTPLGQLVKHVS